MTLLFFITPIIWQLSLLPTQHQQLAQLNPFTHFIELLRSSALGHAPSLSTWGYTCAVALITAVMASLLMRRKRNRIAYWI